MHANSLLMSGSNRDSGNMLPSWPVAVLATLLALGLALGSPTPADAATAKKKCHSGPGTCSVKKYHPHKGTITVKVNVYGKKKNGPLYGWDLRKGNKIVCTGEVREHWKTKTKKCKKVPKGAIQLNVPHRKGASISMAW
ncbi:hypothetical protein [Streptomyces sp. PHES57]|uniref:hypothetical protein n=1 Tax=Streptomyces TaxID=1883 RepID=UPI001CECDB52|nr:hypothetical protein [Streptomyces sp. PHES57]